MSTQPSNQPSPKPTALPSPPQGPALALSALGILATAASSAALAYGALTVTPTSWTLASIQALPCLAILVTAATILGRNAVSPSMALLCASGAVLAAAGLSHLSSGTVVVFNQPMRTWTAISAGASFALMLSAALTALWLHGDALRRALRGLCWALPFLAVTFAFVSPLGPRLTTWLDAQGSIVRLPAYTLAAVVATISLCAATELLVTAFQRARNQTQY